MGNVGDILAEKGRQLISISPQSTVHAAAILMNDHKIGSLLVMHDGRLIGILTERDILQRVVAQQRSASSIRVEEVMTREVICCRPHTSLEEARSIMKHRRVRHLPVISEDNEITGLISIGDLNAFHATFQEKTIYLMQEYIHGHV